MDDHTPTGSPEPLDSGKTPVSPSTPPLPSDDTGLGSGAPAPKRSAGRTARKPAKKKAARRAAAGKKKTAKRKTAGRKTARRKTAKKAKGRSSGARKAKAKTRGGKKRAGARSRKAGRTAKKK
jgi:hypothetical protein